MKLFCTESSSTVNECQVNFSFLPLRVRFVLLVFYRSLSREK